MTVITSKYTTRFGDNATCTMCGADLEPPFMDWHCHPAADGEGTRTSSFCAGCCRKMRGAGFQADLVWVTAASDLTHFYRGLTFERIPMRNATAVLS